MPASQIAFLGAGRMASAMVDGLLARGASPHSLICLSGSGVTATALAARTGLTVAADLAALLRAADTLVLACKPQQLAGLDPRLAELTAGRLVLSVLAGKRLARLAQVFPRTRNLVRAMPNTPGQIGAGITGWSAAHPLTPDDQARIDTLLGALGKVIAVEETQLDALTAVSGSGPAYVFEFAAALREAGIAAGLARDTATQLANETILGAGKLLARNPADAETLRDQVTSPNGTTYAGLQKLTAGNFRALLAETVAAAKARSEELSRD
jgi:pyrroline-5-carboxylate reductase